MRREAHALEQEAAHAEEQEQEQHGNRVARVLEVVRLREQPASERHEAARHEEERRRIECEFEEEVGAVFEDRHTDMREEVLLERHGHRTERKEEHASVDEPVKRPRKGTARDLLVQKTQGHHVPEARHARLLRIRHKLGKRRLWADAVAQEAPIKSVGHHADEDERQRINDCARGLWHEWQKFPYCIHSAHRPPSSFQPPMASSSAGRTS